MKCCQMTEVALDNFQGAETNVQSSQNKNTLETNLVHGEFLSSFVPESLILDHTRVDVVIHALRKDLLSNKFISLAQFLK